MTKLASVRANIEVSGLDSYAAVAEALAQAEDAVNEASDRLIDDVDVLSAHAAVQAAVARVDRLEEIANRVTRERAANEALRRQKRQEHLRLFVEGRKFDECESFVVANDLHDNPQVSAVLDAAKDAYEDANDLCIEENTAGSTTSNMNDNGPGHLLFGSDSQENADPVPLATVQAAVGEAISRIDAAAQTIEREYRVREEQKELMERLKTEKQLIRVSCVLLFPF